jgi:hypothetical protein
MPFIGNKPTAIPLSADDLEDNIISTAKIQDNAVTAAKYIEPIPFRNIIINGDMSLAQRSTSVSSITAPGYNTVDRFRTSISSAGTWTQSQDTTVPSAQGFAKSLKMDCTTADGSLSAGDYLIISQKIEGQNLQYLKKGTSSAESTTLSFWVRSNKTGTYIAELEDSDNSRTISKSYTVSSADTWEKKTLTYAGDTTGAFNNDNGNSLQLNFWLAAGTTYTSGTLATSWESTTSANRAVGQVNLADSTANEWYVTGVQLEAGTSASDFEFLPHDVNLQRCQRYYYLHVEGTSNSPVGTGTYYNASELNVVVFFPTNMRTSPTLLSASGSNYFRSNTNGASDDVDDFLLGTSFETIAQIYNTTDASGTAGTAGYVRTNNASAYIAFQAEL